MEDCNIDDSEIENINLIDYYDNMVQRLYKEKPKDFDGVYRLTSK